MPSLQSIVIAAALAAIANLSASSAEQLVLEAAASLGRTQNTLAAHDGASAGLESAAHHQDLAEHDALISRLAEERQSMRGEMLGRSLASRMEAEDEELRDAQDAIFIEELLSVTGASSIQGMDEVAAETEELVAADHSAADNATALLEMGMELGGMAFAEVEKVHGYCEICTRQLQMYQRALPDLCSGLTDTFFITCVKNMESILKADRAVVYWHQVGCIHLDDGPEIVKPCPAHVVCGWVPNLFARRVGVTQAIGQLAPLCPRDINYLPRVPRTLAPGGLPGS